MELFSRFKNAWNVFLNKNPTDNFIYHGASNGINPSMPRFNRNAKSLVTSIYNKIAVDCSNIDLRHVRLNEELKYKDTIADTLNDVLSKSANIDQTGRKLVQDIVTSMLDEGVIAVVPFETDDDPFDTEGYKVLSARTGKIIQWYPKHILVNMYNDISGLHQEILLEKKFCAIIENPFYSIMNEPNSTARRLMRTLSQIDRLNQESSSGKWNLVVQLPYSIKNTTKEKVAEDRIGSIERQLLHSHHGIAYIDATEKLIQLNRPIENTLWEQAKDLQTQLYNELGVSESIFNGTADEKTMINYHNRILGPILTSITEEMERKWLSKTAQSQRQAIRFFNDPFKLVPVSQLAEIADKFTRNEIMSSNEIRSVIGLKPSDDPRANQLINSNLNHTEEEIVKENPSVNDDMV